MVMTYNTLDFQLHSYLDRYDDDVTNMIPYFIEQAQQRICRESKSLLLETYLLGAMTAEVAVIPKPARWRRTVAFTIGINKPGEVGNNTSFPLEQRSLDVANNYWPNQTVFAQPLFYSDTDYQHWQVTPTPDFAYPFKVGILQLPEPITPDNQTNFITDYAPDVLLYASLMEAIPFLKNDERIPVWQNMYNMGLQSLENQDALRKGDRLSDRNAD